MTKKQRAQVVELLRCAADIAVMGDIYSALGTAAKALDMLSIPWRDSRGDNHWSSLVSSEGPVQNGVISLTDKRLVSGPGYEFCLLEAAARVEEGGWP